MGKIIYLDHAATTYLDPKVKKAMEPYEQECYGNPNSVHSAGRKMLLAVDQARKNVADFLNCTTREIVFTSGATESNNFALRGVIKAYQANGVKNPEIITTPIEHPSIFKTCQDLKKDGVGIKYLPIDQEGIINLKSLFKLVSSATVLVTVMYVNNEIGTIEPIREIGKIIKKINETRKLPIIFHTDGVQAAQYLTCDVDYLHVDLLSLSGHKVHGPQGIGALYVRKNTPLKAIQTGGDQEYGLRAGTLNVAGIVGFSKALEIASRSKSENANKISRARDWMIKKLIAEIPNIRIIGPQGNKRIPSNIYFRARGILGSDVVFMMDNNAKIAISTGSACSAGAAEPSLVLLALGLDAQKAKEGVRVTLDKNNTPLELKVFINSLKKIIKEIGSQ